MHAFGLHHDDADIKFLKTELKELLCHNTDLKGKMISYTVILPIFVCGYSNLKYPPLHIVSINQRVCNSHPCIK